MKKTKIAILTTVVAVLAAGVLAASRQPATLPPAAESAATLLTPAATVEIHDQEKADIPTHVAYGLFFGEMLALRKKADEMERNGRPAAALRDYDKKRANLSDEQSNALNQIALNCNDKVIKINDEAKRIIDRERARHPHGKLREGEQPALPPESLAVLEEKRKNTLLDARQQLHTALGDQEFKRFDDFVHKDIAARTKNGPARKG
jgi:predicted transglutaminase-like cysteine proteinase